MAQDDWRLRIELGTEGAHGLLGRLGVVDTDADDLARELRDERLAVTRDEYLEAVPVADTVLVLQVLAARRGIAADLPESPVLPA